MLEMSYRVVKGVLEGFYRGVAGDLQRCYRCVEGVLQGCYINATMVLQGGYNGVTRYFPNLDTFPILPCYFLSTGYSNFPAISRFVCILLHIFVFLYIL